MATTWQAPGAALDTDRVRVSRAASSTGTEAPTNRGVYAAGTAYVANDLVVFGGRWYWNVLAGTGQQPDASPAYWQPVSKIGLDLKGLQAVTPHIEGVAASGTATCASVVAGDKLTVAGVDFTAVAAAPAVNEFKVGGTDAATAANLAAAINAAQYAGLVPVIATVAAAVVTVISVVPGVPGNSVTLAQAGGHITVSGAVLAGGVALSIGAGASLAAYLVNPATGSLNRAVDFDAILTAALAAQGLLAIPVSGGSGRLVALPAAVGAACTVWLNGQVRPALLGG
jgi:hypothetical protein